MNIIIANGSDVPIYEQIARQLRKQIVDGTLAAHEMLPSIRGLAVSLQVSVITTKRAYDELEREGFVYSETGRGTFVAAQDESILREKILAEIEQRLDEVVRDARRHGVSLAELHTIVDLIAREERE